MPTAATAAPFLYQTRTLTCFASRRYKAGYQTGRGSRCIYRNFSGSNRLLHLRDGANIPTTTSAPKTSIKGGFSIKRTTNMSGAEPPLGGSWNYDHDKSSFRSATEGQKELEIRKHFRKSFKPNGMEGLEDLEAVAFTMPEGIDFDEEVDGQITNLWGKDEIQELTDRHSNRESTITHTERQAFQKIFKDMLDSSQRPSRRKEDFFSDDDLKMVAGPESKQKAKARLDDILTSAILKQSRRSLDNEKNLGAVIERYPPALRPAAARALGFTGSESDRAVSLDRQELSEQELEALRAPECTRVEGLMKTARTDFDLWDVMEKEVFPLIAKLGLEDASPTSQNAEIAKLVRRKNKRGKNANEGEVPEVNDLAESNPVIETGNGVPPVSLYGPLYPSYLLFGLRLLDRGFIKPSPLALALLPRIKSFGFTSHVLGASTQFYNELLRIYHYRQDDFRGMLDLLAEMENSALEVDDETLGIVLDVIKAQRSIHAGAKGPAIRALWSMPEFARGKFEFWRDRIRRAIYERNEARH
jgi:Mtf2 family